MTEKYEGFCPNLACLESSCSAVRVLQAVKTTHVASFIKSRLVHSGSAEVFLLGEGRPDQRGSSFGLGEAGSSSEQSILQ